MSMPRVAAGRRRRLLGLLVANGVLQALAAFGLAYCLRALMQAAEGGALAAPWILAMVAFGGVILVLRIREASDAERLGQDYVTRVRTRLFDAVASRPLQESGARRFGVTITRLTSDLNSLRNWVSLGVARSVVAGFSLVGLLVGLLYFSPIGALAATAVVGISGISFALTAPRLRGAVREARRRRGRLANNLSEKVLAARAVAALGRVDRERARIRRQSSTLRDALIRRARWSALLRGSTEIAWPLAIVGVLASLVAAGRPAAELVVAILLIGMIVAALGQLARALDHRVAFDEGRRRISEVLAEPRLAEARQAESLPGSGPLSLELRGVGVRGVFERIDLRAEAGERVRVVGPAGSGKSLLLALIARLRDPDVGEVLLDGIPARRLELDGLRGAVQLVSSGLPLLRGSVIENVAYGAPEEDAEWPLRAAEACGLCDDPLLGPAGLDARVDEQGANLPQNLRLRIQLARAIAVRPRLLLVDEPAFGREPDCRAALEHAIALAPMTVLSVASDEDEGMGGDRVWRLPEGTSAIATPRDNVVKGIRWSSSTSAV